jgi:glycosyltransferase involved in cell wall biosynthesis
MTKLSTIIITHNCAEFLPGCLKSVAWADEIVVVDKRSTDDTVQIAQKFGAKVAKFEGEAFDEWRNFSLKQAKHEWVLYVDHDERVTKSLKDIIKIVIDPSSGSSKHAAYKIPRANYWWGRKFTACGADDDYVTRLFKKDKLVEWFGKIHESAKVDGTTGTIDAPLIHFTHRDLISGLKKSYNWTHMEAELFFEANHPPVTWWRLGKVTLAEFCKRYFKQKGFTHGTEGFIESAVQAWNRFMVYEQLWELQQKPGLRQRYHKLDEELTKD